MKPSRKLQKKLYKPNEMM